MPNPTGTLGDEASMLAHAASYGVMWRLLPAAPPRPTSTVVWSERVWKTWGLGESPRHSHKHGGAA